MAMSKACISSIKDILMCAICLEDVTEPRMLVCHHSFCTACLKSMEGTGGGVHLRLQCPTCRKYTNVPRGIVSSLPMDCKLNELAELQSRAAEVEEILSESDEDQSESEGQSEPEGGLAAEANERSVARPILCAACPTNTKEKAKVHYYSYCNNCHDYLCNMCTNVHNDIPVFKDHAVICLAGKHIAPRQICSDHSMKYKDYHCEECKQLVCSVCVVTGHKEHTVRPFEQYDKICRDKIDKQGRELYTVFHVPLYFKVGVLTKNLTEPLITCLDTATDRITKKINDAANSITVDIERQRYELTHVVKQQHSTVQKILSANMLKANCETLKWSKEPDKLLNEYQKLSKKIESILDENADVEVPQLTVDAELYDDFSTECVEIPIGTLTSYTLKQFISKHGSVNQSSAV